MIDEFMQIYSFVYVVLLLYGITDTPNHVLMYNMDGRCYKTHLE